jgi:hypothetical protein
MNRALPPSGALLAEVGFNLVAGDRFYLTAFQIVIAAVQHFARLRKICDVRLDGFLNESLYRTSAIGTN